MNLLAWLNPYRWLLAGGLIAALWGWHWNDKRIAVNAAVDRAVAGVRAEYTAAALKASEQARANELILQTKVQKVDHAYQLEKKRRAADAVISAGRVSDLKAALNSAAAANPTAPGGADDPRLAIIDQCAAALVGMDQYAKGLADKASALQSYAREVCVSP